MRNLAYCQRGWMVVLTLAAGAGCHKKQIPLHPSRPSSSPSGVAVKNTEGPPKGDAIAQGLWWLYHLQYAHARQIFSQAARENPADPAGSFYKTATDWWELAQDFDLKLPDVERRFFADAKETVERAQAAVKKQASTQKIAEAHLYWGGAQGLKGRWLVTQKEWMKAYSAGKEGHNHLEKALTLDPSLHDADLGLGIYDYYTDVLPGFMGALSKFIMRGNRRRGIQELETAIHKGPHSRVEAMVFLIEIYGNEEHQPAKALPLAHQLRLEFPQSAAMQIGEILVLNELRRWKEAETQAQDLLDKATQKKNYYGEKDADTGRYLVGLAALMGDHDLKKCRAMMNPLIEKAAQSPSRWITFAFLRRGQSYDANRERAKAKADYERVLSRADVWNSHAEARHFLEKAFAYAID
jgi:hypothetical protein